MSSCGLGIWDFGYFNIALFGKNCGNFLVEQNGLLVKRVVIYALVWRREGGELKVAPFCMREGCRKPF